MKASITYNGQPIELTKPFLVQAGSGRIPGVTVMRKYGQVTVQSTTGYRDVWEFGSDAVGYGDIDYVFPADGTATITNVSSSDASDTGNIVVTGQDINGLELDQIVTLTGQTTVELVTPLSRCYRVQDLSLASTPVIGEGLVGNIYVYEAGAITAGVPVDATTVKAFVAAGQGQTLQAIYTVPAGITGFLIWARSSLAQKGVASALVQAWVRPYGLNFRLGDTGSVNSTGTSVFQETNALLSPIPQRTDLVVRVDSDTNSSAFTARFDILLIDNDCL